MHLVMKSVCQKHRKYLNMPKEDKYIRATSQPSPAMGQPWKIGGESERITLLDENRGLRIELERMKWDS